jgi:hypothetical protein
MIMMLERAVFALVNLFPPLSGLGPPGVQAIVAENPERKTNE